MGSKVYYKRLSFCKLTALLTFFFHQTSSPPPTPYTHSKDEKSTIELVVAGGKRMQLKGSEQGSIDYVLNVGRGLKFGKLECTTN